MAFGLTLATATRPRNLPWQDIKPDRTKHEGKAVSKQYILRQSKLEGIGRSFSSNRCVSA
jgi:hypothetical protein